MAERHGKTTKMKGGAKWLNGRESEDLSTLGMTSPECWRAHSGVASQFATSVFGDEAAQKSVRTRDV